MQLSTDLVYALLAGGLVGLGLLMLVLAVRPARVGIAAGIARLDADRQPPRMSVSEAILSTEGLSDWRLRLGSRLAAGLAARGLRVQSLRSDLAVLGRSLEGFLASTVLAGVLGLLLGPVLIGLGLLANVDLGLTVPLGFALLFAVIGALLPLAAVRREAARRRQDFRHAVGAFLDLVSMNLAGGRGVPEALSAAASVGGGWPFARLRDTLAFARLQGLTPWAALGRLGTRWGSMSCGTCPRRSRWWPTTARRSAPRWPPGRRRSVAASWPRWRARPANVPSRCSSLRCSS